MRKTLLKTTLMLLIAVLSIQPALAKGSAGVSQTTYEADWTAFVQERRDTSSAPEDMSRPDIAGPVLFTIQIGDVSRELPAYIINGEPVFKLRGLAQILDGTNVSFNVEWDSERRTASITYGKHYRPVGGESVIPPAASDLAAVVPSPAIVKERGSLLPGAWLIGGNNYLTLDSLSGYTASINMEARTAVLLYRVFYQGRENDGRFTLSLAAGEREALLNGESKPLSAAPFVEDEAFFFPLKDVVELLGGTFSFDGRFARVELSGDSIIYELGVPRLIYNGEEQAVTMRECFSEHFSHVPADKRFTPRLRDRTVFIPAAFNGIGDSPCLSLGRRFPQNGLVILGNLEGELGVEDVKLDYFYDILPEDLRESAVCGGIVGQVLTYDVWEYHTDKLEIYVMRDRGDEDLEGMDGRVCALRICGASCPTPRGLQVGDTADRLISLYGPRYETAFLTYPMRVELEDDMVRSITFSTRYFGFQL